ncbi:medium-chain fatty acid-CoA ligase faa2 [Coemansia thaxteri]|uniref:Medium-chain fatty acid-CoA ligase faa2 n=1 Tax=Coemansia thaxteri TaxID=2663907 RepID=A0A9W8BD59_9FUNG|nr:medium-chain fatty acid-CoA ligase faa2 [Coemansia thaxteri]KAJ2009387.1 medium-chain fatty acid-CoA ligase faa2 [Coemansia thaxteri]KAJ2473365.1 medium-chain fatty acid-CoA ligase faa2 [Coemansia sp. RSA 2322]KAJ2484160.1 medium-chain fatty acid-CoA ligase faa2 [Coemansia sp. RSA 2320]
MSYYVPSSAQPGYSSIIRNRDYKDGKLTNTYDGVATIYEMFQRLVRKYPDSPLAGTRKFNAETRSFGEYEWISTSEAGQLVRHFGSGLDYVYQKYAPRNEASEQDQEALGIYSINRAEWLLAEIAGFRSRRFSVALYDTLGAESIEFIMNHANVSVIVCSIDKVPKLLKLKDQMPRLKAIISMDEFAEHGKNPASLPFTINSVRVLHEWAGSKDVALLDMAQVVELGKAHPTTPRPPKPDDLCTICYTSGTTGKPKGVMSTHDSYAFAAMSSKHVVYASNPVYLSFLPMAHCFERIVIYVGLLEGGSVGFYSGNVLNIADDAQALRPTVMAGVPRLFNRIYDRIAAATIYAPGVSGAIARTGFKQKLQRLEAGQGVKHAFWDRVVCGKIRQFFGGRLELIISGSAPIDGKVLNFLRVALAATVVEGYASTECNAAATVTRMDETRAGHVGRPYVGVDIRLRDVPEMGYLVTDSPCPRGEILIRARHVFKGYYKEPDKTKAAMDGEWLITGDIGQFEEDGNLKVIDRRKNIFKLAQGEYVAAEYLETVYSRCPLIQNIFVYGDSLKSSLVAVVVPDPDTFIDWARQVSGTTCAEFTKLCGNEQVVGALLDELQSLGRESKLQGFEIIRHIHCDSEPFNIEGNGLLTSTFKLKRHVAREYYREQIDSMYRDV